MNLTEIIDAPDLQTVKENFTDEHGIVTYLEKIRWQKGVISPFDLKSKVYICKNGRFRCKNTGKYFNVKTNTLFHNSKIPLSLWFQAIWIIANASPITSVALGKELAITQKSAWYMLKRIKMYLKDQKRRPVVKKNIPSRSIEQRTKQQQMTSEADKLPLTEWLNLLRSRE